MTSVLLAFAEVTKFTNVKNDQTYHGKNTHINYTYIYIYTYVQWTTDLEVFLILVALAATSSGGKKVSATVSQPETKAMSKGKA